MCIFPQNVCQLAEARGVNDRTSRYYNFEYPARPAFNSAPARVEHHYYARPFVLISWSHRTMYLARHRFRLAPVDVIPYGISHFHKFPLDTQEV